MRKVLLFAMTFMSFGIFTTLMAANDLQLKVGINGDVYQETKYVDEKDNLLGYNVGIEKKLSDRITVGFTFMRTIDVPIKRTVTGTKSVKLVRCEDTSTEPAPTTQEPETPIIDQQNEGIEAETVVTNTQIALQDKNVDKLMLDLQYRIFDSVYVGGLVGYSLTDDVYKDDIFIGLETGINFPVQESLSVGLDLKALSSATNVQPDQTEFIYGLHLLYGF